MAKFSKIEVISAMASTGMVPVFYNKDIEISKNVLKACYDGGVRAFEFTNRGDLAHEVFCDLIKFAAKECPEMILGVGSVVGASVASADGTASTSSPSAFDVPHPLEPSRSRITVNTTATSSNPPPNIILCLRLL